MDEQVGFIEFGVLFGKGEGNCTSMAIPADYMWPLMRKFGDDPEAVKRAFFKVVADVCVESFNDGQVDGAKPSASVYKLSSRSD